METSHDAASQDHKQSPPAEDWRSRLAILPALEAVEDWSTPFVVMDLDLVDKNIVTIERFFSNKSANVRPHIKTHKCSAIARNQVAAHGAGVTCSTTNEVEAMVAAGIDDILLANVVTDRQRLAALARSAQKARVMVNVDSEVAVTLLIEAVEQVGASLGVLIEYDIGMRRNGVRSTSQGIELAELAARSPYLEVRGVSAYEGHLVDVEDREERREKVLQAFEPALELLDQLQRRGFDASVLTGGSTATYQTSVLIPQMTDVQAGTYLAMDETYRHLAPEFVPTFVVAGSVLTSRQDGSLVLDIGVKRIGIDWGDPVLVGVDAAFRYIAEEHTVFQVLSGKRPGVGERVAMVPGHACTTLTRYRRIVGSRNGNVEAIFDVDGRDTLD